MMGDWKDAIRVQVLLDEEFGELGASARMVVSAFAASIEYIKDVREEGVDLLAFSVDEYTRYLAKQLGPMGDSNIGTLGHEVGKRVGRAQGKRQALTKVRRHCPAPSPSGRGAGSRKGSAS